ncbi:MAG: hypothetical protein ACI8VW_000313 [bacterium]|jgi:hypothetical protein
MFDPKDLYRPMWHFSCLAGITADEWTSQYHHWICMGTLDDGGDNVVG